MELIKLSHTQHEKAAIICYPHAGGGIASYKNFHQFLPDDIGLYVFNYHAETQHDDSKKSLQSIASKAVPYLEDFTIPIALLGHSMGALIAYESARDINEIDAHLFLSGHVAPHVKLDNQDRHKMSDDALLNYIKEMGGTPEILFNSTAFLDMFLPVIRHDFHLCDTYTFRDEKRKKLPYPITAFTGTKDKRVPIDKINAWSYYTNQEFQLYQLEGGHFFIFNHIETISNIIIGNFNAHYSKMH